MNTSKKKTSWVILFCWACYDWANSAFGAIIQTFVFPAYFTRHVVRDENLGILLWGLVNGFSALVIAFSAPVLGAIADQGKGRKGWIFTFTSLCITATMVLWFVPPEPAFTRLALCATGVAIIGSELAFVFYNATLPAIAPASQVGRWSGWGWGIGYVGGVAALSLALFLLIGDDSFFTQSGETLLNQVRATFAMVALWYAVFSLPLFLFVPDTAGKGKRISEAIQAGLKELGQTVRKVGQYQIILRFLIARIFYIDGLTTLFVFGGVYAAELFHMSEKNIVYFGLMLNIAAGIGAFSLAVLDDIIGPKKLIILSLVGLIVPVCIILFVTSLSIFWLLGAAIGIFVGPVQSASRSYMARAAPAHLRNEMFGFFALSGKVTAFLGPILVGLLTYVSKSQRVGISVVLVFLGIGLILMLTLPSQKAAI